MGRTRRRLLYVGPGGSIRSKFAISLLLIAALLLPPSLFAQPLPGVPNGERIQIAAYQDPSIGRVGRNWVAFDDGLQISEKRLFELANMTEEATAAGNRGLLGVLLAVIGSGYAIAAFAAPAHLQFDEHGDLFDANKAWRRWASIGGLTAAVASVPVLSFKSTPVRTADRAAAVVNAAVGSPREEAPDDSRFRPLPPSSELIVFDAPTFQPDEALYDRVHQSVVTVRTSAGTGTAFLVSDSGLAITNHHVVSGERLLTVAYSDGTTREARVLREDSERDVALIQIAGPKSVPIGAHLVSHDPRPGDEIVVVGSPLGENYSLTMTKGIVSGLRYRDGTTWIQTDAAINPGNSGAPMINLTSGAVVGIATWKIVDMEVEGMHFSVSFSEALRSLGLRVLSNSPSSSGAE